MATPMLVVACGPDNFPPPLFEFPDTLNVDNTEFENIKIWVNSNDVVSLFRFIAAKFEDPELDISNKFTFYKPLEFWVPVFEHDSNQHWISFYITDPKTKRNSPGSIGILVSQ